MAKGKVISQMIHEGVMDMIHGGGHRIRRVVVDGLALTYTQNTVYVFPWTGSCLTDGSVEVVAENVDVPDEIVAAARQYLAIKEQIAKLLTDLDCSDKKQR